MFRQLIQSNSDFTCMPLHRPMYADVSLVWRRDVPLLSCMKKFADYVKTKGCDIVRKEEM